MNNFGKMSLFLCGVLALIAGLVKLLSIRKEEESECDSGNEGVTTKEEKRPMIVGFQDHNPQETDCGKQSITFKKGRIDVVNVTTMEEDPSCNFSAATRLLDDEDISNITDVYCKETGTKDFILPKGEVRTIHFEGTISEEDRERLGFDTFEGEYEVLGI